MSHLRRELSQQRRPAYTYELFNRSGISYRKHPLAITANGCFRSQSRSKVQFQAKLELTRVEGGGGAAAVATVAGAFGGGVHVFEAGRGRCLVEAVEEVEALGDDFEAEVLAEADVAGDAHVERGVGVRQARVAPQRAGLEGRGDEERAVRGDRRAVGAARQVVVGVLTREDVEGAARGDFEDGRDDEVGEEAAPAAGAAPAA